MGLKDILIFCLLTFGLFVAWIILLDDFESFSPLFKITMILVCLFFHMIAVYYFILKEKMKTRIQENYIYSSQNIFLRRPKWFFLSMLPLAVAVNYLLKYNFRCPIFIRFPVTILIIIVAVIFLSSVFKLLYQRK
jgi:hypothetical protein